MTDTWSDVHQSFSRCLQRSDFLSRFYTIFIDTHPAIAETFRGTDWKQQVHLLRHGVSASILYAGGGELGTHELQRLHKSHGKKGYDIKPWMYDNWLDALMQTLAETDSQFDPHLEQRWRDAMGIAIARIRDGRDIRARR